MLIDPFNNKTREVKLSSISQLKQGNQYYIDQNMPQLVPFYFINQVTFGFATLLIMLYLFSKYILPKFLELFLVRLFITKL